MTYTDGKKFNTTELYSLALSGLNKKYELTKKNFARKRLNEEFAVIINNGLTSLFFDALTVRTWIEEQGIMYAPGYAHIPSSVVAYVLDITRIDPLHNGLYFERFFNTNVIAEPFIPFVIPPDYIQFCESLIKSLGSNTGIKCLGCENIKLLKRYACFVSQVPTIEKSVLQTMEEGRTQGMEPEYKNKWIALLKGTEPDTVDELVNLWTLSRPGLDILIPLYLERKKTKVKIACPHPDLIPIFKSTLGLCLFQEQIIETLSTVCGITPTKAEWIRRILAKKKHPATEVIKTEIVETLGKKGYTVKESNSVFDLLYKHAGITYCKAHAAAEARLHYEIGVSLNL